MNKRVSVIIPCYNGEKTIDQAIESVYIQNYSCTELVVVDDGSTDRSKEIIDSWMERFSAKGWSLRYVYQENKGPGGAINTGLKYVTGEYLSLLDADDEYLPGAVPERAAYLREHPQCDVVRSNGWMVKGEHRHLFVYENSEKNCKDVFLALLRGETNNWAGSYMVRTEALFQFYPDREIYTSRYGQNLQLLLPLLYGKPCGFIDKPMMNYIQQDNSLSQTTDRAMAKKRNLENAAGYKDIRVFLLRQIVKEPDLQAYYLHKIEGAYWRGILSIAREYKDCPLLLEAYRKLKAEERPKLQDKIIFYQEVHPIAALFLRGWNKLRRMMVR